MPTDNPSCSTRLARRLSLRHKISSLVTSSSSSPSSPSSSSSDERDKLRRASAGLGTVIRIVPHSRESQQGSPPAQSFTVLRSRRYVRTSPEEESQYRYCDVVDVPPPPPRLRPSGSSGPDVVGVARGVGECRSKHGRTPAMMHGALLLQPEDRNSFQPSRSSSRHHHPPTPPSSPSSPPPPPPPPPPSLYPPRPPSSISSSSSSAAAASSVSSSETFPSTVLYASGRNSSNNSHNNSRSSSNSSKRSTGLDKPLPLIPLSPGGSSSSDTTTSSRRIRRTSSSSSTNSSMLLPLHMPPSPPGSPMGMEVEVEMGMGEIVVGMERREYETSLALQCCLYRIQDQPEP